MRRRDNQPASIGDLLSTLAGRVRKVDLLVIDEVRALWPELVEEAIAQRCRPDVVRSGVLVITVPNGAFSQRILEEEAAILAGLAVLGERAPTSIRAIVATQQ